MKKNTMKTVLLIALLSVASYNAKAQNKELKVGNNPTIKQPSAVLEVDSANKGMLLPRVALTSLDDVTTIANPANALTVFNTATTTTGTNDVTPGYYYWNASDNKWMRLLTQSDAVEPWYLQTTTAPAQLNTEDIYQTGSVAIGKNAVQTGAKLDVEGAVRGGSTQGAGVVSGAVGANSVAFGTGNTASGEGSVALGGEHVASGGYATTLGWGNEASGFASSAFGESNFSTETFAMTWGQYNTTSGAHGTTFGQFNTNSGYRATIFGQNNIGASGHQLVFGRFNAITGGNVLTWIGSDPLLQIGNGSNESNRTNALTILKDGKIGTGPAIAPTETIDVGKGGIRIREVIDYPGDIATDKIVVADADGVLKTVAGSNLAVEPWQIQTTSDKATANTDNIYQMGTVAIGKNEVQSNVVLDVEGATRLGGAHLGNVGPNSVAIGTGNTASGTNSFAGGSGTVASGEHSFAFGENASASELNTVAIGAMSKASGDYGLALGAYAEASEMGVAVGIGAASTGVDAIALSTSSIASGRGSVALGVTAQSQGRTSVAIGAGSIAYSAGEVSLNKGTSYVPLSTTDYELKDRLFNIGNSLLNPSDSDAFTILKDATTGIGFSNFEATTFNEKLQVNGNARFAALPSVDGDIATDKVVVADADGVLKTVAGSSFSNIYNANGSLTSNRTLDFNGRSLTFEGATGSLKLETGGGYMTLNGSNPDRARFRLSTDDINNNGTSSIFDMSLFSDNYLQMFATGEMNGISFGTHVTLDPSPIEFLTSPGGGALGEVRMTIEGNGNIGIDESSPTQKLDVGTGNVRVREIVLPTNAGDIATDKVVVADADGVLKTVAASAIAPNVTTNNGITKNTTTNEIELGGSLNRATTIDQNGNELAIATGGENLIISGLDKTKVQATVNGATTTGITDHLLAVGADNTVKALKAAMPKFFFMPSIIIPTSEQQLDAPNSGKVTGDVFDDATLTGTINLYGRYQEQFSTTGTAAKPSNPGAPALPVLPASELNYYVTWYDPTVFTSVTINASGVMTYEVDANADVTTGSFMNIVFSVKED